jgi:hypothetical protein
MVSENHQRGKWEGEIEERIKMLQTSCDSIQKTLSEIFSRLNSLERKLAAVSPFVRLIETALIALTAALIARIV